MLRFRILCGILGELRKVRRSERTGAASLAGVTATEQKTMFFDSDSSARTIPNIEKLKALDGYYGWRREEARKKSKSTH